jgi:predicted permease
MSSWIGDLRYALRQLGRAPGFTAAAVGVLALGIGLNAGMFALVYAVGLAGRAFPDPDRVVQLYSSRVAAPDSYRRFSHPAFEQIARSPVFAGVLAHLPAMVGIGEGGGSRRTLGTLVSQNYFDVLGVSMVAGRGFNADESRPGQDVPVVIVNYLYWQRRGLDPGVVGSTVRINERPYTVIGVTPPGFSGTMTAFGPELFFPFGVFHSLANEFGGPDARRLEPADAYSLVLVGRLAPSVSIASAGAGLVPIAGALAAAMPGAYRDARLTLAPLPRFGTSTSPSDQSAVTVVGAVMIGLTAAVLLTVCLNLAAMLLARGRARRRELAIRMALGSGRARLVRQLLIEGLVLSLAGGGLGALAAGYAISVLQLAFAAKLPMAIVLDGLRWPMVAAVTLGFCLLATIWFALGPALRHSRVDVLDDLRSPAGADSPAPRRRFRPRHPLTATQLALSLALLIAAGLFTRMAQGAMAVDLGYDADDTVLVEVDSALGGYDGPRTVAALAALERRLRAQPGVAAVGVGAVVPMGMFSISKAVARAGVDVPEDARPASAEAGRAFDAPWNAVGPEYFAAMGVPLRAGRTFSEREAFSAEAPPVAILDTVLAGKLWPDGTALGQRIRFRGLDGDATPYVVIGIVAPTRQRSFDRELPGGIYLPIARNAPGSAFLHVRPIGRDVPIADAVREAVREVAPGLPMFSVRTFREHIDGSIEFWALGRMSLLLGVVAAAAIVVALVGIYGVIAHSVVRRTREIGIRMAVGATPSDVRRLVFVESVRLTLAGVTVGLLLGAAVGQVMGRVFTAVAPFDLVTFTVLPAALAVGALVATWLPARRATRVDPMLALRAE